jgi:glucan phosphoethanolaminetransferase (alkaline phosphatase superfamily)
MKTFKCWLLCFSHLSVYGSITLLPDVQDYLDNPIYDIIISCLLFVLLVLTGLYIVFMPLTWYLKYRPNVAFLVVALAIALYTIFLALLFVFLAPVVPPRILHESTVICGSVGLAFAVLVVYDNMQGAHIKDTYNEIMHALEEIERNDTTCGIEDDDDVQRIHHHL